MNMIDYAADYAVRGWKVFPLAPSTKIPLAGTNGFKDATTDIGKLTDWWTASPDSNIGLATGSESGVWVIDIDRKKGKDGKESVDAFSKGHGEWDIISKIVTTPNGGEHWYVKHDDAQPISSRAGVLTGVDIRGNGGYVVLPPSRLPTGTYAWVTGAETAEPKPATSWVAALPLHCANLIPTQSGGSTINKRDSSRVMSWDLVIQGKHSRFGRIKDLEIGKKYQCYCPFHEESNISAFCKRISEDYAFVYCSSCDASWRTEPLEVSDRRRMKEINERLSVLKGHQNAA